MKTSSTGRKLIESYEGLILQAYDDANDHVVHPGDVVKGVLTIGYGHTSSAGAPKVSIGDTITKDQADRILAADLTKVELDVEHLVKVPLNQNQFDALVSFHFNTGALGKSTLLKKLNAQDYQGAADGLMAWTKAAQIGPGPIPGLVRRRQSEKDLFLKTPSKIVDHATTGAVVVGTGAVVSQTPSHLIPYVIAGGIVVLVIWLLIKHFKKG